MSALYFVYFKTHLDIFNIFFEAQNHLQKVGRDFSQEKKIVTCDKSIFDHVVC